MQFSAQWYARCLSNSGLRDLDCSGNGLGDTGAFEVVEAELSHGVLGVLGVLGVQYL